MANEMFDKKLPENMRPLFWSYNFNALDVEKDRGLVIAQVINYGTWRQWKWIAGAYGEENIKKIISTMPATGFRPGALKLASLLFSIDILTYAPRGSH